MTTFPEVKIGSRKLSEAEVLTLAAALDVYARVQAGQLGELTGLIREGSGPGVEDACRLVCEAGAALHPGRGQRPLAEVPEGGVRADGLLGLLHRRPEQYTRSTQVLADRSVLRAST